MSWTQAICDTCYAGIAGDKEPMRLQEPIVEKCCLCGIDTEGGIYVRLDPKDVLYPSDA